MNPTLCKLPSGIIGGGGTGGPGGGTMDQAGGGGAVPPGGAGSGGAGGGAGPNAAQVAVPGADNSAPASSSPYYRPMVDSFTKGDMKAACSAAKEVLKIAPNDEQSGSILYKSCWGTAKPGSTQQTAQIPKPPAANPGSPSDVQLNDGKVAMLRSGDPSPTFSPTTNFNPGLQLVLSKVFDEKRSGRYKEAAADAKEGLKLYPTSLDLLNAEAYALNKLGQLKDALAAAEEALKNDPRNAAAWANKAYALAGMGDKNGALAALKEAAEIDPAFADAYRKAMNGDLAGLLGGDGGGIRIPRDAMLWALAVLVLLLIAGIAYLFFKSAHPTVQKLRTFVKITPPPAVGGNGATVLDGATRQSRLLDGRYELGPRIGAGGMGEVFSGTDKSLGRKVAIKKMLPALAAQPKERERFVSEARTVAALHHPNIVDIHAIVEDGADIYLVFEYVEGKTLADLVRGKKLAFHDAVKVIKSVATALEFAHSKDIVHRDLKPANIMIDQHGMVKVMDFGLARSAQDAMTKLQMTSTIVGTPAYMAPEQDNGVVCKQSDVYALGVTLYELLAGGLPFEGGAGTMMAQKLQGTYKSSAQLPPGLPGGFDDFFKRVLEPDVAKRIAGVKEFTQALDSLTTPSPA